MQQFASPVSPIENTRNSSLIGNKYLNVSYEKLTANDDELANAKEMLMHEKMCQSKCFSLDSKFIESGESSIDDESFSFDDEELANSDTLNKYFVERKNQKSLHKEFKSSNKKATYTPIFSDDSIPFIDEDETNEKDELTDSSINDLNTHFWGELMMVSPIAHEHSNLINGEELKDVSNAFSCDLSSFME